LSWQPQDVFLRRRDGAFEDVRLYPPYPLDVVLKEVFDVLGLSEVAYRDWSLCVLDSVCLGDSAFRGKLVELLDGLGLGSEEVALIKLRIVFDALHLADALLVPVKPAYVLDVVGLVDEALRDKTFGVFDVLGLVELPVLRNKLLWILDAVGLSDQAKFWYAIRGVVRNDAGAAVHSVVLLLFRSDNKVYQSETASDGSGNYTFDVPNTATDFFIVAFKEGVPNKVGASYLSLRGEEP